MRPLKTLQAKSNGIGIRGHTGLITSLKGPFLGNSIYLMVASLITSGSGVLFWAIAAREYSVDEIGMATALISMSVLIASAAMLGMDQSMIRFFPEYDKTRIMGTAFKLSFWCSALLGAAFAAGASVWLPDLTIDGVYLGMFIALVLLTTAFNITGWAFVADRRSKYAFVQSLIMVSRLVIVVPFVILGTAGILTALIIPYIASVMVSLYLLSRSGIRAGKVDRIFIRTSLSFSAASYATALLLAASTLTLPILVYGHLGASNAALYYMAYSFASVAFIIPTALSTSLFVEGSHGVDIRAAVKKSVAASFLLLVPTILALFFFGDFLLGLLGGAYAAGGTAVLELIALSTLFYTAFQIELSVLKVRKDIRGMLFLSFLICFLLLVTSSALMTVYGILGVGYAWIASYAICASYGALRLRPRFRNAANISGGP